MAGPRRRRVDARFVPDAQKDLSEPYSTANKAQMIQSSVSSVVSVDGDRSATSGMTSRGMIASDRTSISHAVCRSNRSSASADPLIASAFSNAWIITRPRPGLRCADARAARRQERDILERAVTAVSEQAAKADELVDKAIGAGLDGSHPVTVSAKMLRLELLKVKADLERKLGELVLDCSDCGRTVHWIGGLGVMPGHWAHREPAPHGEPAV